MCCPEACGQLQLGTQGRRALWRGVPPLRGGAESASLPLGDVGNASHGEAGLRDSGTQSWLQRSVDLLVTPYPQVLLRQTLGLSGPACGSPRVDAGGCVGHARPTGLITMHLRSPGPAPGEPARLNKPESPQGRQGRRLDVPVWFWNSSVSLWEGQNMSLSVSMNQWPGLASPGKAAGIAVRRRRASWEPTCVVMWSPAHGCVPSFQDPGLAGQMPVLQSPCLGGQGWRQVPAVAGVTGSGEAPRGGSGHASWRRCSLRVRGALYAGELLLSQVFSAEVDTQAGP